MAGNTTTAKKYGDVKSESAIKGLPSKTTKYKNSGGDDDGQLSSLPKEKFAETLSSNRMSAKISGIEGLHNDIGESSGFITDGYLDKGGTPYGEAAKFNFLPPGMDINNQENAEIHDMPMRKLVAESYPDDGWSPTPRNLPE